MFLIAREGGREVLWLSAGENLCATSSTFAGRRHMIGKVVTGCVAILPYHTATQDRRSECRDFGFISRIVTALQLSGINFYPIKKMCINLYGNTFTKSIPPCASKKSHETLHDVMG